MEALFPIALVAVTSLLAALLARWAGRSGRRRWSAALRRALDAVGLGACFFVLNVAAGAAAVLVTRAVTGTFLSAYLVDDVSLVALSLLQGLVFAGLLSPGGRARPERRGRRARRVRPPAAERAGTEGGVDGRRPSV